MKFDQLIDKRVDLFSVDVEHRTIQLGYRLDFYLFGIELFATSYATRPILKRTDPDRGGPTHTQIKGLPLSDLDLQGHARLAVAGKRTRERLARVVVEDSARGAYYTEVRKLEAERDARGAFGNNAYRAHFSGYRLRDPRTNHTWLTFGTTKCSRETVNTVFKYTPPGAPPCPPR